MTRTTVSRTGLYRLYDADDTLLYVGIAVDPSVRWRVHAGEKTWWHEVTRKTVEWHSTRLEAEAAEVAAIVTESPRYNVENSTTRTRGDAQGEYRSKYNKPRQIRVATQIWTDFGKAAKAVGTTRGALIAQFVRWYLSRPGATLPKRPDPDAWKSADTTEET